MTGLDPWRERPCVVCGAPFKPKTHGRRDADRAQCCSLNCSGKQGAKAALLVRKSGRVRGSSCMELSGADLVQCARCYIRGHVAGDPERCLRPVTEYGHAIGNYGG